MTFSRRDFLKTTAASFGALIVPPVLLRARPARSAGSNPVLVALFLRGAADWLNLIVPHADPTYHAVRPNVAVPLGTELDLDGFFGLNPAMAPLLPYFQSGRMAAIHACGSPSDTRSHFDAQDFMEFAAPGDKSQREGWLNRFLVAAGLLDPFQAISIQNQPVRALDGSRRTLAVASLSRFALSGGFAVNRRYALADMYAGYVQASGSPDLLGPAVANMHAAIDVLQSLDVSTSVSYPSGPLGDAMRDLAAIIKGDVGLRVAGVNAGGWDHHDREPERMPKNAGELAGALASFAADLGPDLDRTVVLVMTEFGRRVAENGSDGTDHGHGAAMLALGGGIAGGRVILRDGQWPGLEPAQLDQGNDLAVTTDFRDIFAEILARHMGLADLSPIFPNYATDPSRYPGLFV